MKTNAQHGFTHIVIVIIFVVVSVAAVSTGFYLKRHRNPISNNPPSASLVSNYEECLRSIGSTTLQTFPETCVTSGGKQFVKSQTNNNQKSYLIVKEWGVKLSLTNNIKDAFYLRSDDGMMHITTHTLQNLVAQAEGCRTGLDDIYLSRSQTNPGYHYEWVPKYINGYYYYPGSVIEPSCVSKFSDALSAQITPIQTSLRDSLQGVIAESANTQL